MNRSGRQASSLTTTLVMVAILAIFAFGVAGMAFSHLNVSKRISNLEQARNLAESAVSLATEKLLANPKFGTTGNAAQKSLTVTFPGAPGAEGRLTFDDTQAALWDMPVSLNNVDGDKSVVGFGRALPAYAVQLVGMGSCNGVTRKVESVVLIPKYKFAIASSGSLVSSGGLLVEGINSLDDVSGGVDAIAADKILPGHVASNGNLLNLDSNPANRTHIRGDAISVGSVVLGPSTLVDGSAKSHAEPAPLPEIHVTDYDPATWTALNTLSSGTYTEQLVMEGAVRRAGNLHITTGGISLNNAYLYVNGDLEVSGPVTGKGVIFATGKVTFHDAASFSADNIQAIVAQGNVTVGGTDKASSFFQGLVYTEGDVVANDVTLVGCLVANKKSGSGSTITLNRVNVVALNQLLDFNFNLPVLDLSVTFSAPGNLPGMNDSSLKFVQAQPPLPAAPAHLTLTNKDLQHAFHVTLNNNSLAAMLHPKSIPPTIVNPINIQIQVIQSLSTLNWTSAALSQWVGFQQPPAMPPVPGMTPAPAVPAPNLDLAAFYDPVQDKFDENLVPDPVADAVSNTAPIDFTLRASTMGVGPAHAATEADASLQLSHMGPGGNLNSFLNSTHADHVSLLTLLKNRVHDINDLYQKTRQTAMQQGHLSFDPNRFIQFSDKSRQLIWREF